MSTTTTQAPAATALMEWLSWEENRYHDSDGYTLYWDPQAGKPVKVETWSTRYANDGQLRPATTPWTQPEAGRARQWLAAAIARSLRIAEDHDVLEPQDVRKGERVRVLAAHRCKATTEVQEDCRKCGGTGHYRGRWSCHGCEGTGKRAGKGAPLKDAQGKQVWHVFDPGLAGEAFWCGAFGTFYRNGYKQPNRFNRTVGVRWDDGRSCYLPLQKLRLDREPETDALLEQRAWELSRGMDAKAFFTGHGGWLDANPGKKAYDEFYPQG
jgi:hypothetical protein